ncbi:hypothetical protein RHK22_15345 [Clostridioides difficile]|nr:hypothetical protein [Clostridioides difficile]
MQEVKVPVPPKRFILTKWYVNKVLKGENLIFSDSFILTKWYVNRIKKRLTQDTVSGFISTKGR